MSSLTHATDILNVFDDKDPTAAPEEVRRRADRDAQERMSVWDRGGSLRGLRVGVPREYFPAELSRDVIERVREVVSGLQARGATVVSVSLPSTAYALGAYYVLSSAEASSNMARYDGVRYGLPSTGRVYAHTRTAGFGPEVQKRVLLGTYALTAGAYDNYFLQAQRVRRLVQADFEAVFYGGVDVIVHASAIGGALALDGSPGLGAYVQDVLTVPASLAGIPAVSVPCGPVGVSVAGKWGSDGAVLRVAEIVGSESAG